jgi:NAD(P)-dependent dehydrogenase (short-subunit alcohol dehydrogenase family)
VRRKAIVTGSDSGIGRATAIALAAAGHDIGITWHTDEEGARATAREVASHGGASAVRRLDLTEGTEVQHTIEALVAELGGLDVLVNNAGANHRARVLEDTLEDWRRTVELTLTGPFLAAQAAARHMVAEDGGRIVNITSVHERDPLAGAGAYCAAKAGLAMLTKVMALELAPHGVTVNAIAPGHIATPMTGKAGVDVASVSLPQIPVGRPGDPTEIAALVVALTAPGASYVTGASLIVDGGLLLTAASALQRAVEPSG